METSPTSTSKMESHSRWSMSTLLEWTKQFFTTSSQLTPKVDHLAVALELLAKQHATLDKIVTAKYDQPTHSRVTEQRETQPMFPPGMMYDVLSMESDEEFLKATEGPEN